jgi:regulator of PEP synthase PpsR (kinase-PPPase family)
VSDVFRVGFYCPSQTSLADLVLYLFGLLKKRQRMSHIRRKRKCSLNQLPNFTFINFSDILSGTERGSGL